MIKAGIIGTGIGLRHFDAINNYRDSKVVCILEKDKKKIQKLKRKFKNIEVISNEKLFFSRKDMNLVSISSYDEYHYSQIMKSIKKKCNVIVEKPICLTLKELRNINNVLKKKRISFASNLALPKNPLFSQIKKKIEKKNIYYIEADYLWGRKHKLFGWRSKTKNYSLTLGATIHMLDLICWLLKSRPLSVFSKSSDKMTKNSKFKKFSFATYIFTFPKNIIVKLSADSVCIHPHYHALKIFEKNQTFISDLKRQLRITKKGIKEFSVKKMKYNYFDKKSKKNQIRSFVDSLIDKNPFAQSSKSLIDLMTACFFADLSLKRKRELKINYLK